MALVIAKAQGLVTWIERVLLTQVTSGKKSRVLPSILAHSNKYGSECIDVWVLHLKPMHRRPIDVSQNRGCLWGMKLTERRNEKGSLLGPGCSCNLMWLVAPQVYTYVKLHGAIHLWFVTNMIYDLWLHTCNTLIKIKFK